MNKKKTRKAVVYENTCVACGCCVKKCKLNAITVYNGVKAIVNYEKCVGCGMCAKECPSGCISIKENEMI